MGMDGKQVVVTAAAQGIGRATAEAFARAGTHTPEEIAGLAVYLSTATYTAGQIHIIDGGGAC